MPRNIDPSKVKYNYDDIKKAFEALKDRDNSDIVKIFDVELKNPDLSGGLTPLMTKTNGLVHNQLAIKFDEIFGDILRDQRYVMEENDEEPDPLDHFGILDDDGDFNGIWDYVAYNVYDNSHLEYDRNMCKAGILALLCDKKVNILYAPEVIKGNDVVTTKPEEAVHVGAAIMTRPQREREAAKNTFVNTMKGQLDEIAKGNHSEIFDLKINNHKNRRVGYSDRDNSGIMYYKFNQLSEEMRDEAVSKFDELYGKLLETDKDFLDHVTIFNNEKGRSTTIPKLLNLSKELTEKEERGRHALKGPDKLRWKKILFMRTLTEPNVTISYKDKERDISVPIDIPPMSDAYLNEFRAEEMHDSAHPVISTESLYGFSFNSAENFNRRLEMSDVTEEELNKASDTFDKAYEKLIKADRGVHKNIVEIFEFQPDDDMEYTNVMDYVNEVHAIDNLTPEQAVKYAKAYILHALVDPREAVKINFDVIDLKTGNTVREIKGYGKDRNSTFKGRPPKDYPKEVKFDLVKDSKKKKKNKGNEPKKLDAFNQLQFNKAGKNQIKEEKVRQEDVIQEVDELDDDEKVVENKIVDEKKEDKKVDDRKVVKQFKNKPVNVIVD